MKLFTKVLIFLLTCSFFGVNAQTARVQIIHNSPSPTVDIWVNGSPFQTNFAFRTATPFVDVPAGVELEIGIAPSPSTSTDDIIATFPVTLSENQSYVIFAEGVVGDDAKPFTLNSISNAKETALSSENVDFVVSHGSPDAPMVDVDARGVAHLLKDFAFGMISDYVSVPSDRYLLDVRASGADPIVATFEADLSGLGGNSITVFASGYLAPTGDQPAFGLFAALSDGTVVALPTIEAARMQIIHNSASPTVDIWVNDAPFLTNFEYRKATPFVEVPAGVELNIGIAPSPSSSPDDIIANFPVTLENGQTYITFAQGLVGDMDTPFTLNVKASARQRALNTENVDFIIAHGSTDAPAVDISARDVATLAAGAAYGDITDYISVPAAQYLVDIRGAGTEPIVASFDTNLEGLGGNSAVVFASGFLAPMMDQPAFGLFAALADGTVVELPAKSQARLQVIHNSPSPTVDIWVNDAPFLTDFNFRTATPYVDVPGDVELMIGVAPSPSTSPDDIIATFPVTLANGSTFVAVANGIVGNTDTPFGLTLIDNTQLEADPENVAFKVVHGSPDAPAVDVIANSALTIVDNAAFGDVTDFISVPPAIYTLDITPAEDNENILFTYNADLSTLGGQTAIVFASGLLAGDPDFGIYATLADGTTIPLPLTTSVNEIATIGLVKGFPNPTTSYYNLNFDLTQSTEVQVQIINASGQLLRSIDLGDLPRGEYQETIDTNDLQTGLYHFMIQTSAGSVSQQVMVVNK